MKKQVTIEGQLTEVSFIFNDIFRNLLPTFISEDTKRERTAVNIYIKFIFLLQPYLQHRLVHNHEINSILHTHILDENKFNSDCKEIFGSAVKLVHTAGFGKRGPNDRKAWLKTFEQTRFLFEKHFGKDSMGKTMPASCESMLQPI
mgnify:CR=1 FL=1